MLNFKWPFKQLINVCVCKSTKIQLNLKFAIIHYVIYQLNLKFFQNSFKKLNVCIFDKYYLDLVKTELFRIIYSFNLIMIIRDCYLKDSLFDEKRMFNNLKNNSNQLLNEIFFDSYLIKTNNACAIT